MLRNVLHEASTRPCLAGFLMILVLTISGLTGQLLLTAIEQHRDWLENGFRDYPLLVWAGLFMLSISSLMPLARRQVMAATNSWLASLPQMPQAAQRHSKRTLWLLYVIQSSSLLGLLAILAYYFTDPVPWFNWILALAMPAAAALATNRLATATSSERFDPLLPPGARSSSKPCQSISGILRYWQWATFCQSFWAPATRWAIGGLLILIPAGASTAGVAITLLIGWAIIQTMNAWTACLRVIVEASSLLRALPTNTGPLLWTLAVWPLTLVCVASLLLSVGLLMLGAAPAIAILVLLFITSLSLLALSGVLAWRHQGRIPQRRILAIIMLWLLLAQSILPAAPVFWLLLVFILIQRAFRR